MSFLAKNPISGLDVIVSRDDAMLVPKITDRKLDQKVFRAIKENKTKIIKERSKHIVKPWQPL